MKLISPLIARTEQFSPETQGIIWMLVSCFFFSVMAITVRHISETVHPFALVFYRNVFALIIMLPVLIRIGRTSFTTQHFKLHFWRGLSGVIGMLLFMIALAEIPTPRAIALSFTAPLFTTIAAIVFLNEKVGIHRWGALIVGFIGVLIILRPGLGVFEFASLIMIAATCTWSVSGILVKKLSATERPEAMLLFLVLLSIPLSIPMLMMHPQLPSLQDTCWLFFLGIISSVAQFSMFKAYAKTEVTVILPFDFSRLIFVTIFSYFLFGEVLDMWTGIGAMVIILSTVYISRREAKGRKKAALQA